MKQYRIYTENKNKAEIIKLFRAYDITIYETLGTYKSKQEYSLVIEIIGVNEDYPNISAICKRLKEINQQDVVLLTIIDIESHFI